MTTPVWSSRSHVHAERVRKHFSEQGLDAAIRKQWVVLVHPDDVEAAEQLIAAETDEGGV